ncbi:CDP-glycerol glycerophosphotransferase family protein [Streptomyces sp. NPDC088354]|uniref:CDP-glycerol glycerophosphotransferase family protein n=1 Tax=Streptomyces sp. NPDC088354 TaxID=3365856 RepID=UPI00382A177E
MAPRTPRLTVVVPVHNVEAHVAECLASVAAQTLDALDVVVVDDGSTDAGAEIARSFADRDPRFRLVRQEAAGLGHARNTGVRHADPATSYLAFLDGDDVLPPRAYETLVRMLDASSSDFATGNAWRLTEDGREEAWPRRDTSRTVPRTHVTRDPALLSDRAAWNKVFRRDFWERHHLAFPEDLQYEDAPLTLRAHFLAEAVDVLHDHVHYRRVHEGSAAGRRTEVRGVRGARGAADRVAAVDSVSRFLADPAHPARGAYKRAYDRSVLTDDLQDLVEALPIAGPEYRRVFMERCRDFLSRADPGVFPELPVAQRIIWHLVAKDRLDDLVAFLDHQRANPSGFTVAGPPLRKRAVVAAADGTPMALPPSVVRLRRADLSVHAEVAEVSRENGRLVLRGHAYLRNIDAGQPGDAHITAVALSGRRRRVKVLLLPVRIHQEPAATVGSRQEEHCYDWSGFEITVDPARLRPGRWRIAVVVAARGVIRTAGLRAADLGSGASPQSYPAGDGTRVVPYHRAGRLHLSVDPVTRTVVDHRAGPDQTVELDVTGAPDATALRLTLASTRAVLTYPVQDADHGVRRVRVRLADLGDARPALEPGPRQIAPETTETWEAVLMRPGRTDPVHLDGDLPAGHYPLGTDARFAGVHRELLVEADAAGRLVLRDRTPQPVVDAVGWTAEGALVLTGRLAPDTPPGRAELVLRHGTFSAEHAFPVRLDSAAASPAPAGRARHRDGRRFTVTVRPGRIETLAGTVPLAEGRWDLWLRAGGHDAPVRVAPAAFDALPMAAGSGGKAFTVDRHRHDRLFVEAGATVPEPQRGPYRQRVLRETHYPRTRGLPRRDTVLYSSFDGRSSGDSPRAVHEELLRRREADQLEHLWVVRDGQAVPPGTARPVVLHSAAWYEALARSRYVVTNTHLPPWFVRRPDQRVLQTWHGAPVKRTGRDLAGTLCAELAHLPRPPRDTGRQWSVLLSPNAHSTGALRTALAFDGEVAETGLPRTDVLFADDRDKIAASLRDRLGIPRGRTVVLYAPTRRDDRAYDAGHYRRSPHLDLAGAEAALGRDHVLLYRSHPMVADRLRPGRSGFVRDVSAHPDAAELLLLADVLVTDYASLAADFANTGRPMLFLVPDLEHVRDTLRGFYPDFEAQAPGPLLHSTAEVAGALRDLDTVARHSADAYAHFRATFCHLDDGGAAARATDRLLGLGGTARR